MYNKPEIYNNMILHDGCARSENNYCRIVNVSTYPRYSSSALAARLNILILLRCVLRDHCISFLTEKMYVRARRIHNITNTTAYYFMRYVIMLYCTDMVQSLTIRITFGYAKVEVNNGNYN